MTSLFALLSLVFTLAQGHSGERELDCADYSRAYLAIDSLINANVMAIPGFVRLAFHDCVGAHGCNGCLNLRDTNNNGLEVWAGSLEGIYKGKFDRVMSRADFWQLAAQVALIRAASNRACDNPSQGCTFFDHPFYVGRRDCPTSPYSDPIPDNTGRAHGDYSEVRKVLHGNFGLTDKEAVAAMGAHTLGGGFPNASGFTLPWSENFLTFDNEYFKNILQLNWAFVDTTQTPFGLTGGFPRWQFIDVTAAPLPLMMLNVDMALWKDLRGEKIGDRFTGEVSCVQGKKREEVTVNQPGAVRSCRNNKVSAKYVQEFAADLGAFYRSWEEAWYKMTTRHGLERLHHCGNCIPAGGICGNGFIKSGSCCGGTSCKDGICA